MNTLLLFVLCLTVYSAVAVPLLTDDFQYPRYYNYTDENGVLNILDLEAAPDMNVLNKVTRNPNNNMYLLYTRRNPELAQALKINNIDSIHTSYFDASEPVVVLAHGWLSNHNTEPNPTVRAVYLAKSNVNIIVVDWSRLATSTYSTAARGVPAVGRGVGEFLNFLNRVTGVPFNNMHLIGFSLGAHLLGSAGRNLGGRVARITGLDPAGPLWSLNNDRLSSRDAIYVEVIHTDGGYTLGGLGIGKAIADVDFFPNGGISQPGCLTNICNHNRAWEFFAATVTYNHLVGNLCTNSIQISMDRCRGTTLAMGNDDLNKKGFGQFRTNTRRRYPF